MPGNDNYQVLGFVAFAYHYPMALETNFRRMAYEKGLEAASEYYKRPELVKYYMRDKPGLTEEEYLEKVDQEAAKFEQTHLKMVAAGLWA